MDFKITGAGDTLADIQFAVEEALARIMDGNIMGFDRNESGSFYFEVDGQEAGDGSEDDCDPSERFVVVDTTLSGEEAVLGRFATEDEASSFIETLPEFETGRYGLDDMLQGALESDAMDPTLAAQIIAAHPEAAAVLRVSAMNAEALRAKLAEVTPERNVIVFDGTTELRIDRLTLEPGLVVIHAYAD